MIHRLSCHAAPSTFWKRFVQTYFWVQPWPVTLLREALPPVESDRPPTCQPDVSDSLWVTPAALQAHNWFFLLSLDGCMKEKSWRWRLCAMCPFRAGLGRRSCVFPHCGRRLKVCLCAVSSQSSSSDVDRSACCFLSKVSYIYKLGEVFTTRTYYMSIFCS